MGVLDAGSFLAFGGVFTHIGSVSLDLRFRLADGSVVFTPVDLAIPPAKDISDSFGQRLAEFHSLSEASDVRKEFRESFTGDELANSLPAAVAMKIAMSVHARIVVRSIGRYAGAYKRVLNHLENQLQQEATDVDFEA